MQKNLIIKSFKKNCIAVIVIDSFISYLYMRIFLKI